MIAPSAARRVDLQANFAYPQARVGGTCVFNASANILCRAWERKQSAAYKYERREKRARLYRVEAARARLNSTGVYVYTRAHGQTPRIYTRQKSPQVSAFFSIFIVCHYFHELFFYFCFILLLNQCELSI